MSFSTQARVSSRARSVGVLLAFAVAALALPLQAAVEQQADALDTALSDFLYGGPMLLLDRAERSRVATMDPAEQLEWIDAFLARDPDPQTAVNELEAGIAVRQELARGVHLSMLDDRAKLLFLHGPPTQIQPVDCDMTYKPMEIWTYGSLEAPRGELVLFQSERDAPYRLWIPLDSKQSLYTREMEYWLDQYDELKKFISGRRVDYQLCKQSKEVDRITGVDGLLDVREDAPSNKSLLAWLRPPGDLERWSREALISPREEKPAPLLVDRVELDFPERRGGRLTSRVMVFLPKATNAVPFVDDEGEEEFRFSLQGLLERGDEIFEDFRIRFQVPPQHDQAIVMLVERSLRPEQNFLLRLRIRDEISGAEAFVAQNLDVPQLPTKARYDFEADDFQLALERGEAAGRVAGADSLLLVPPESDVVLGVWRSEALVSGARIVRVQFLVDGDLQFTKTRAPFRADVKLARYPREHVVRVEGYDAEGQLVAADELIVNQQRGELKVAITEPKRGVQDSGEVRVEASVVVPEERRVRQVEFSVNGQLVSTTDRPPWSATVTVPEVTSDQELSYIGVAAELDDGLRAEDVRFLNAPDFMEQVEVDLVELFTTVTDRSNRLSPGLSQDDFEVFEDGRPQTLNRFELVEDLPLTLGVTIDTSGSMIERLGEARRTAVDFLRKILTPKDQSFAVSFSNRPVIMMPRTSDVDAVEATLDDLTAVGMTSLYDAVITSLYYFRGVRGRRALVVLSDGEDTASTIPFKDALEYAKRSGVAIYTIGLDIGKLDFTVRDKLSNLSNQTGGRSFFIKRAEELALVYGEIEKELRSQYLLAYNSDQPAGPNDTRFREVEVKVRGAGLKARTIKGYYP